MSISLKRKISAKYATYCIQLTAKELLATMSNTDGSATCVEIVKRKTICVKLNHPKKLELHLAELILNRRIHQKL